MSVRTFFTAFIVALLLEATAFGYYYSDLLYLRQPAEVLAAGDAATFTANANGALERRQLTRQHLETIARTAQLLRLPALEARALERRAALDPRDANTYLRLADAMRRAGRFAESEQIYLAVLEVSEAKQ